MCALFYKTGGFYISIPACHLHIKDFQAFVIMPVADCLGAAKPSSVLYWALSLSVGRLYKRYGILNEPQSQY